MLYASQTFGNSYYIVDTSDWTYEVIKDERLKYLVNDLGISFNFSDSIVTPKAQKLKALRGGMGASFLVLLSNFIACSDYLTDDLRRKLRNTLIKLRVTLLKCNRVER